MKRIIVLFAISILAFSCDQRIELDEGQWGTHADVTSGIYLFKWVLDDVALAEGDVEGAKTQSITATSTVNVDVQEVIVAIKAGEDLTKAACYIYHDGVEVEPLNGAPTPGVVSDYSGKEFVYRIHSADGEYKDWTLIIE